MKKISIIIPCYNSVGKLEKLLTCFERQTLGIHSLELIFIDDCSEDNTCSIITNFYQKFPENVIFIRNQENHGVSYSRNFALSYATTPYISYADHDDLIEPELYEIMYETICATNSQVVLCEHDWSTELSPISFPPQIEYLQLDNPSQQKELMFLLRNDLECWSKLIRRDFLLSHNIHFPTGMWGEDFYWWSLIGMHLSSFAYVHSILYHHTPQNKLLRHDMQNWMNAQIALQKEAKERNLYTLFQDILDLELFEIGFASTCYYWLLEKDSTLNIAEFELLHSQLLDNCPNILQNRYIQSESHFRYVYSKYAKDLINEKISARSLLNFIKNCAHAI